MRMLMQSIINNRRSTPPRTRHSSTNTALRRSTQRATTSRRQFELNNGYHHLQERSSNTRAESARFAPTIISATVQTPPSSLRYNLFQTSIDVCANNLTSELENNNENSSILQNNNNRYYSTFEYESLSIRFFHNEPLGLQNIDDAIENVIDNINNREIQNILNDFQNSGLNEMSEFINNTLHDDNTTINDSDVIRKIEENVTHGEYIHYVSDLKNHTCPILLCDFEDDDIVSIFNLCNHAIHESTYDKYVKTFTKCPLCNNKLFQL
jgi:hypothetical protein